MSWNHSRHQDTLVVHWTSFKYVLDSPPSACLLSLNGPDDTHQALLGAKFCPRHFPSVNSFKLPNRSASTVIVSILQMRKQVQLVKWGKLDTNLAPKSEPLITFL